jgi:hypothetical protein
MEITPYVAQNQSRRRSRVDQRTTRHPGCEVSQRKRKRIEEVFGRMKTVGLLQQAAASWIRASGLDVHAGGGDLQLSSHADADAEVCLKLWKKRENRHCETNLADLQALAAHKITNQVDRIASKHDFSASC